MASGHSNDTSRVGKATSPWLHKASGQWVKKVRGRFYYFGVDQDQALERWILERDDILAGRPPKRDHGQTTLGELVNAFLTDKEDQANDGRITRRSFNDYYVTTADMVRLLGRETPVSMLSDTASPVFASTSARDVGRTPSKATSSVRKSASTGALNTV